MSRRQGETGEYHVLSYVRMSMRLEFLHHHLVRGLLIIFLVFLLSSLLSRNVRICFAAYSAVSYLACKALVWTSVSC